MRQCAAIVIAGWALSGCTLPAEQLTLPGPKVLSETGTISPVAARNGGGVATSDAQVAGGGVQTFDGSGRFTDHPLPRPIDSGQVRNGITINLVGASVPEAAKAILGDVFGASYVVSDKVKAKVTLQTARPVPRESVLEIFEEVLRAEGAALVQDRGIYKIMPQDEALAAGAPIVTSGSGSRAGAGMSTQIIPLRFVSAPEMERIIKSVSPRANVIRVDPTRNLLVVVGTKSELASIADTVSVFDVDYMRGMSFAIHPIESADPDALVQELDTVFSNDRDGPGKGVVRFVPNKRLKSILVISSRPEYLSKARTWIERLDLVGQNTEKQVYVYRVQSRPASELALLVQRVYSPQGGTAGQQASNLVTGSTGASLTGPSQDSVPRPLSVQGVSAPQVSAPGLTGSGASSSTSQLRGPGVTGALLNPSDPTVAADPNAQVPGQAPQPGVTTNDRMAGISVVPDDTNNSIVVTATPSQYRRIQQILNSIDVTPVQVLLEATIAEVTLRDQLKFGVRWFFKERDQSATLTDLASGAATSAFPGFSYFLNGTNVKVALNALSSVTDVNVVSSPTLMVLDNKKAQLQVGDEVPIATQSSQQQVVAGAPIVNSISFRNTGVILSITPRVGDRGRILLEIEQEVSDAVPTDTSNLNSPTIQQRRVRTTVSVNDGESIFLAGLIQDRANRARDQMPVIGNVPVIGNLFKNKDDLLRRTELIIAITPTVVKDSNHVRAVTDEFRDKINLSVRPQRAGPPDRRENWDRLMR